MSSMDDTLDLTEYVTALRSRSVLSAFREFSQIFAGEVLWWIH